MSEPPPPSESTVVVELTPPGGVKRLLGPKGEHRLTMTPQEFVIEHSVSLQAPLRFAPGSVLVACIDPGPATVSKEGSRGRFPILRRIGRDRVIPRSVGIEGWLWTSVDGSTFAVLGDDAPNLAFLFSPPLAGERVESAFGPALLAELANRSPLGQPAVFGLLLRAEKVERVEQSLERYGLTGDLTDREVPPTQRRHLPDDKAANPAVSGADTQRAKTSMPPPGMG